MIDPAALKPHLLHEDWLVREAAARYFEKRSSRDADLAPLVLSSLERFGEEEAKPLLAAAERFALTPDSLDGVIRALGEARDPSVVFLLSRIVARAPAELLLGARERILAEKRLVSEQRSRVHRRIQLSRWPAERLWSALVRLARNAKGPYTDGIDLGYAEDLVDALAPHGEPPAARICELLEADEGWLEIFAVDLAGARGIREAVPALVEKLHIDTDYLLERVSLALVRIGDPSASGRIRAAFPAASWNFKLYASGVLADLKVAESEEALLALLDAESDPTIRVMLCVGLCEQLSERGLPLVLDEIRRGYEPGFASLEEAVLPVAALLGVRISESHAWRSAVEREREELRKRLREPIDWDRIAERLERGAPGTRRSSLLDEPDGELDDELLAALDEERDDEPPVSRNASCPCGSGRKFKRCCGRAA
jgi:hypothetical protein